MDFDTRVKMSIYQTIAETTRTPTSQEVATMLQASRKDVETAFQRLHEKRLLVPEPGDPSRIRMAPPFSGIETVFPVHVGTKTYFANCIWDALGIAAALHQDAMVHASDGHTGEPIVLEIKDGAVLSDECVIHFAVPAALWWKDIIYT